MARMFVIALAALTAACSTFDGFSAKSDRLPAGRFDYNEAIARSTSEQLLLNIVRLRYRDPVNFLEVSNVITQYVAVREGAADTAIGLDGPFDEVLGVAGAVTFEERPTISYAPLQGPDYARRLLTPISAETLLLLSQSGWSSERVMLCCVDAIAGAPNAPTAAGPTPEDMPDNRAFRSLAAEIRALQLSGDLVIDAASTDAGLTAAFKVAPAGPDPDRTRALLERLGAPPGATTLPIAEAGAPGGGAVTVRGRGMLGVLSALSQAVEAPPEHVAAGVVNEARPNAAAADWDEVLGGYFHVRQSKQRPDAAAVAVRYRGYWFYIADDDLDSKSTFDLVGHLFALQASAGDGASPLLTLGSG